MGKINNLVDEILKRDLTDDELEYLFRKVKLTKKGKNIENLLKTVLDTEYSEEQVDKLENEINKISERLEEIIEKGIENVSEKNQFSLSSNGRFPY